MLIFRKNTEIHTQKYFMEAGIKSTRATNQIENNNGNAHCNYLSRPPPILRLKDTYYKERGSLGAKTDSLYYFSLTSAWCYTK